MFKTILPLSEKTLGRLPATHAFAGVANLFSGSPSAP